MLPARGRTPVLHPNHNDYRYNRHELRFRKQDAQGRSHHQSMQSIDRVDQGEQTSGQPVGDALDAQHQSSTGVFRDRGGIEVLSAENRRRHSDSVSSFYNFQ